MDFCVVKKKYGTAKCYTYLHTWYLSHISHIRYVEKNLSCGEISDLYAREIWNFSTCGVISNFFTWQMWRNLKFLHSWHVYDVENVFKCVHNMLFCWKMGFVVIYAVCREICFDAIYALLCGEKLNQRLGMWRKNDKYQVWLSWIQVLNCQNCNQCL